MRTIKAVWKVIQMSVQLCAFVLRVVVEAALLMTVCGVLGWACLL